jgi:ribosome modulation factor
MERFSSRENTTEFDKPAYMMGYQSRAEGKGQNHNPYRLDHLFGKSWLAGWCDADMCKQTEQEAKFLAAGV